MFSYLRYRWRRLANRRYLGAERRVKPRDDFSTGAAKAHSSNYTKGGYFTK